MSMDMTQTTSAPQVGRVHIQADPAESTDVSARALLQRLLEAQERLIRAQRAALDAYAREVGQLATVLRSG